MKPHAIRHTHRPLPTHHVTSTDDGDGDGGDDVRWRRKPDLIHSSRSLEAAGSAIDCPPIQFIFSMFLHCDEYFNIFHLLCLTLPLFSLLTG